MFRKVCLSECSIPQAGGGSAPLWSLSALGESDFTLQSFYVQGLLPVKPQNAAKHSAGECNKAIAVKQASAQTARVQQSAPMISDCSLTKKTPQKPSTANVVGSEEITSSQAADVEILAELADSVTDVSMATQQMASHDEEDIPASGFCLPVEDAWKDMVCHIAYRMSSIVKCM